VRTYRKLPPRDLDAPPLVSVEAMKKAAFEDARITREAILNTPPRFAGELAAESDAAHVQKRLDAAIREAVNAADAHRCWITNDSLFERNDRWP
jgi:hypothetical protein